MLATAERVLLIEDNASYREVVCDYLTESGYAVVMAEDGVQGLREVMNGDFAVILCDMVMPKMPGEMFYRAVERVRPELCERFIFMTGHTGSHETIAFIRSVDREVLIKPFRMRALVETLDAVRAARLAPARGPIEPPAQEVEPPAVERCDTGLEIRSSPSPAISASVVAPMQPVSVADAERRPASALPTVEQRPLASERSRVGAYVFLVISIVFVAGLVWFWRMAVERSSAATAEFEGIEMDWTTVSAQLEEAGKTRPGIEKLLALPERLAEERDAPRWTPALRSIATSAGPEIEFRLITARSVIAKPGAARLSIQGSAVGSSRLEAVERFRQALQTRLDQASGGRANVKIEELDDEPASASTLPEQQRASFFISVIVGGSEPAETSKPKR